MNNLKRMFPSRMLRRNSRRSIRKNREKLSRSNWNIILMRSRKIRKLSRIMRKR